MNQQEEWRTVAEAPDYLVSDQGRVASTKRWRGQDYRVLKCQPNSIAGYPYVQLYFGDGSRVCRSVHTLVAAAFIGPRPDGLEVCHNDGDPANATLSNLRYDTHSANELDKAAHGTHYLRERTECVKGHPYDEQNTRHKGPDGRHRSCRTCGREWRRRYEIRRAFRAAGVSSERAA